MAGTRSSARQAAQKEKSTSSPQSNKAPGSGSKRKADASSPASVTEAKRGRPSKTSKEQKTLEETVPNTESREEKDDVDERMKDEKAVGDDVGNNGAGEVKSGGAEEASVTENGANGHQEEGGNAQDPDQTLKDSRGGAGLNALDQVKADEDEPGKTNREEDEKNGKPDPPDAAASEPAVEEEKPREQAQPENIMEKGIVYFFSRGRVGIDDPSNASEIQRSYMVLRPLPAGGKLTEGAVQDVSNNRLIALPKKVWPKSGRDRFMVFVEKAGVSMDTLKEEFFQGSEYSTKSTGTRHTPAVTPIGEGVYAISYSGDGRATTHLSYMMTIPQDIGEVQKDVGLAEQGSFILSTKNPNSSAPANAIPAAPEYPKELIDEFGSRGWLPSKPQHIDYVNACVLLIGESSGLNALEAKPQDAQDDNKETPAEEVQKLEHEDEIRIDHMKGDDTVYADLGLSKKEYPSVKSTW